LRDCARKEGWFGSYEGLYMGKELMSYGCRSTASSLVSIDSRPSFRRPPSFLPRPDIFDSSTSTSTSDPSSSAHPPIHPHPLPTSLFRQSWPSFPRSTPSSSSSSSSRSTGRLSLPARRSIAISREKTSRFVLYPLELSLPWLAIALSTLDPVRRRAGSSSHRARSSRRVA
jgi:hypothetical protein